MIAAIKPLRQAESTTVIPTKLFPFLSIMLYSAFQRRLFFFNLYFLSPLLFGEGKSMEIDEEKRLNPQHESQKRDFACPPNGRNSRRYYKENA